MAGKNTDDYPDVLMEHDADGIQEFDNPSPPWLIYGFYLSILFAFAYVIYYGFNRGPSVQEAFLLESKQLEKEWADYYAKNPIVPPTTEELVAAAKNPELLALGKDTFVKNCAACHGDDGQGLIGPNLTDDRWIHGGKMTEVYGTIVKGVSGKGMPPWGRALSPEKLTGTTVFIRSLQGTKPANPKAPEGDPVVADPI
jgi:cytochrome c oxidase cbb3-type subunit 3